MGITLIVQQLKLLNSINRLLGVSIVDYFNDLKWLLFIIFVAMSSLGFLQLFNVAALIPLVLAFGIWGGFLMVVSIIWLLKLSSKYARSAEQ